MSETLKTIGVALMFATILMFLINFWAAYFSPSKCAMICVNAIGEGDIELILSIIVLAFSVYVFVSEVRN